jgi:hypothetical protein
MWECRARATHGVCVGGVWKLNDFLSPLASFSQHPSYGNAMQVFPNTIMMAMQCKLL